MHAVQTPQLFFDYPDPESSFHIRLENGEEVAPHYADF